MPETEQQLIRKFQNGDALVGIVGMGYVGLPLALRFSEVGRRVLGFDIDQDKAEQINAGQSYIHHIPDERIAVARDQGLIATAGFARASECDALILCVPTPLNKYREPDLNFVIATVDQLKSHFRPGQIMVLESTTYPGTMDEEVLPRVKETGLEVGKNFFLVYSPEREDPGNIDFNTRSIPKIVGGHTEACLRVGLALYESAIEQLVPVSSTRVAEMTKLLENIHRAVNIGLVNEMKVVADRMGIDIFEVVDAAATKPFGFTPYYPGPGLGGHCIPIDPYYLTWKAREYGLNTRFIELSGEVNRSMPEYVITKLMEGLNDQEKPLKGSRILVLGLAYKKNVGDTRESPSVEIMELLHRRGARLSYSDPHVSVFPKMRDHDFDLESVSITAESLAQYDGIVLATHHDDFDYQLIRDNARLIVDTRGVYREPKDNIIKA